MTPFDEIEQNFDLERIQANGLPIYPLIRLNNIGNPLEHYKKDKNLSAKNRLISIIRRGGLLKGKKVIPPCDILFLENNTYQKIQGTWINKFTHPIKEWLGKKGIIFESLYTGGNKYSKENHPNHIDISSHLWLTRMYAIGLSKLKKDHFSDELIALSKTYEKTYPRMSLSNISKTLAQFNSLRDYYSRTFSTSRPKLLIVVNYYSLMHQSAIYAAKERGIPVLEIQHGVQGNKHYAYAKWQEFNHLSDKFFPSVYWNWNLQDTDFLNSYLKKSNNVFARTFGHPFIYFSTYANHKNEIRNTILISLQPFSDLTKYDRLREAMTELSHLHFELRLHPSSLNSGSFEQFASYFSSLVTRDQIIQSSEEPLTFQLLRTKIHLTYSSSVCLEAGTYGIPNIIIDQEEAKRYEHLKGLKLLYTAETTSQITEAIKKLLNYSSDINYLEQNKEYFNNGLNYIESILR